MNCKHKLIFLDSISNDDWSISAYCPICRVSITDEELKQFLLTIYVSEVAEQVFSAFINKRSYYQIITELAKKGVNSSIFPVVIDNE